MVQQILTALEKEKADLVVVGRFKWGKFDQLITGANVAELVHRGKTPVLVYNRPAGKTRQSDKPFFRPLLATDWSESSVQAIDYLKRLEGIVQQVNIVHVADEKSITGKSAMAAQKTRKQSRQKLDDLCDKLAAAGIEARPHVYVGDAVEEIQKAVHDCMATMLITGTSTKGLIRKRLVKSIPQTLSENLELPLLLLPPTAESM